MSLNNPPILVFSFAYKPFEGGAEVALKEIMARMPERRFIVLTRRFSKKHIPKENIGNVLIMRLGNGGSSLFSKLSYIFLAWREAEKLNRVYKFKIIWSVMAAYGGFAALIFKLMYPQVSFLLTLQEGDSEEHILSRVGIFYPFWKLIFKKADYIQAISNYLADFARRHGARCPIEIIPNGVEISKFQINSKFQTANWRTDTKIIITTSRLVYKNGIDVLIRACAKLEKDGIKNWRLEILGEGPLRNDLENLTEKLGIKNKVSFFGHIASEKIHEYLMQADIFVRPSRSEGLGSSFLEAMAAGLPVIGTPIGGITDFLKSADAKYKNSNVNDANGFFIEVNDFNDLAGKIKFLLENKELKEKLGQNARKLVFNLYSWDLIANRIQRILTKVSFKKILIVTGIFPPDIGGSASYSALLKDFLPIKGFKVSVLTYGEKKGNELYSVSRKYPKGLRHVIFLLKIIFLGRKYDFILAADSSFGAAFMAAISASILKKKFFVRVTGDYAWEQSQQRFGVKDFMAEFQNSKYSWPVEFLKKTQKFSVKKADVVIAPSSYLKNIVFHWGVESDRIVVINNAVMAKTVLKREIARKQLDISNNEKIVISIGRLVPWKGFRKLIEIFPELAKSISSLKLFIIGDGPDKESLQLLVLSHKLQDSVFLMPAVSKAKLFEYLSASDIFVLNSAYEGFSHQIIEAMSAGVPVLVSDAGGNSEIVKSNENGILFGYNDAKSITAGIIQLFESKELMDKFSKSGTATARNFSVENMISKLALEINKSI